LWVKKIIEDLIEWTKQEEYFHVGVYKKIGVLGPEGSFSEEAALQLVKSRLPLVYFSAIEEVFKAVLDGKVDYGVVPIENTTGGTVIQTLECLLKYDVEVFGETKLVINHCLVSRRNIGDLKEVKVVYSHPQAILQCYNFIKTYFPSAEIRYASSTAEAIKLLDDCSVAIASETAALLNKCVILKRGIQDLKDKNITRFYLIRKPEGERDGNITALFFSVEDKPGALKRVLDVFYEYNINLRKLESHPDKYRPGKYIFFTEAEAKLSEDTIKDLKQVTEFLRICGVFRQVNSLNF
jgi:chorismate mutase/prephenate dehydratase